MDETKSDHVAPPALSEQEIPIPVKQDDEGEQNTPMTDSNGEKREEPSNPPTPSFSSPQRTSLSSTLQNLTDKALHFLSHASNGTLGACLVGLGATTYLVLGRVGLLVIGVAGGVVLHATWDGIRSDDRDEETKRRERQRRRETGVEVVKRVLEWRAGAERDDRKDDLRVYANQELDYSRFEPETETALNAFTDAVIKDYVYYWYAPSIPGEEAFPKECRRTFTAFILSLSSHLERKRPADAFLDFVTNASSIIIVLLNELSAATHASPNSAPTDAIATYLQMKPDSSLAYMLDKDSQEAKLADAAEDILQAYLDQKAYNCAPVHVFLKQVLAKLILGYTVDYCSAPEWINDWIVYGLEESETTKEVMNIVDAGVEGRDDRAAKAPPKMSEEVQSRKEFSAVPETGDGRERERNISKGEEAMDEAMREAKRLTQLMIEEDEKRAREESEKQQMTASSSEDVSDIATTHGAPTPTSSQSDRDRQEEEASTSWSTTSQTLSSVDSPVTTTTDDQLSDPATPSTAKQQFTSFDQLVPSSQPTALSDSPGKPRPAPSPPATLTLHNARISIFDDSQPNERSSIKAKPTTDYLIQIEPASSAFRGWMISRQYADFETLHEVLRRISVITGVVGFTEAHAELPKWKVYTKASLRQELERYLTDAVRFQPLAESEGMKRFLEKDQGLNKSPGAKGAFGWPTPDAFGKLGGDMMNVLTKAPKQVAGGGKAVFGGVAGLVGGVSGATGSKRQSQHQGSLSRTTTAGSTSEQHRSRPSLTTDGSYASSVSAARQSQDSLRAAPPLPARHDLDKNMSTSSLSSLESKPLPNAPSPRPSLEATRTNSIFTTATEISTTSLKQSSLASPSGDLEHSINLPPPPSEMPEDYGTSHKEPRTNTEAIRSSDESLRETVPPPQPPRPKSAHNKPERKPKEPITESETSVAIELMFAVITELYTLSSAWQIRRTLLSAAKSFLLRPGNPQLVTIRDLLQTSLLDSNLSDAGIASHIYQLRANGLPTTEELDAWKRDYPEKNAEEKEELRIKARRLLVQKGLPTALQSVMGAAASGEAMGKVFDCLQIPAVSRGLVFGMMLQAVRVVTH